MEGKLEEEVGEIKKDNRKWFIKGSCLALVISPIIFVLLMVRLYVVWPLVG